jgi:hypothetical protein
VRACPYCAEEIQDAAIVCRFCGRDVAPSRVARSSGPKLGVPSQRWYRLDARVRQARAPQRVRRGLAAVLAKIGGTGLAAPMSEDGEPSRRVRKYASLPRKP